ncbi:MAG: transposase [Bacillota bacterium]|nr:transposase [Bacillota bacterium]
MHPYGKNIPSQRSSELFSSITEEGKEYFFRLQGKRRSENEYWAYDTTSISSYSESLKQVKYGHNKDHDPLPQINLALLFGEESNLPFYYRKLAGNRSDVKTVKNLLADIEFLGFDKVKLVMDRGFYSEENINRLYQNHLKFICMELDKVRNTIRTRANYNSTYQIYSHTAMISWNYSQDRPYKGDTIKDKRRMYLHIYFNSEKALEHENNFNAMLDMLEEELVSERRKPEHEKQYTKYFNISTTPIRGTKVTVKQEAVDAVQKDYGFFALISNEIKDPIKALEMYHNKDLVEKAFGNLKERLKYEVKGKKDWKTCELIVQIDRELGYVHHEHRQLLRESIQLKSTTLQVAQESLYYAGIDSFNFQKEIKDRLFSSPLPLEASRQLVEPLLFMEKMETWSPLAVFTRQRVENIGEEEKPDTFMEFMDH